MATRRRPTSTLIVEVGANDGALVAFDKWTGELRWKSEYRGHAGHTGGLTPITVEDLPCVAFLALDDLVVARLDAGHEGKTVATYPWRSAWANNVLTPARMKRCQEPIFSNGAMRPFFSPCQRFCLAMGLKSAILPALGPTCTLGSFQATKTGRPATAIAVGNPAFDLGTSSCDEANAFPLFKSRSLNRAARAARATSDQSVAQGLAPGPVATSSAGC